MHAIKIGWCHSLFVAGKEHVTSEFPRVNVIKKFWDYNLQIEKWYHVLTWSWCHIYSGKMISWFIFTCLFFIVLKHKMALPYQARHSRIVRRSHEFQSLYDFRFYLHEIFLVENVCSEIRVRPRVKSERFSKNNNNNNHNNNLIVN